MPIINRAPVQPLLHEGPMKAHIIAVTEGRSTSKRTPYFEVSLRDLATGRELKTRLYLVDAAAWKVDALCRSSGLILPPDGAPYELAGPDLTGRVCYALIKHTPTEYGIKAEVTSFWSPSYALQHAPELAQVPDPPRVPAPKQLSAVNPPPKQ
jgi:hypothetical protein